MSFDKEKTRRAAEKNLSQGKIQAAIRDYSLIAENDPKDFNTLNMLGDLYVRVDAKSEAMQCFTRIAEHYNLQGFAHKAIAMYKKMLRLQPGSFEISAKLAPLYQTLGLFAEARSFYLAVAEHYQKNNDQIHALEIWSKIADLDPNDTATRLKLAESYIKENQREKAVEAYIEAGNRLLAKKQTEEAAAAFAAALELKPTDIAALSGATSAGIALGLSDEAAERLARVYELCPDNTEILSLLAHAHIESENVEAAEEIVLKLVEREPSSYKRHLDVVRLYLKEGNVVDAARVLGFCGEMLISNNSEEELLFWINEVLARNPEELTALRLLARVRAWQRNEDELKIALERLVESAQLNNAVEDERAALVELATLFPEDERYIYRLREIGGDVPETHKTNAPLLPAPAAANDYVPTFESFNTFGDEQESSYAEKNPAFIENDVYNENHNSDNGFVNTDDFDYSANGYETAAIEIVENSNESEFDAAASIREKIQSDSSSHEAESQSHEAESQLRQDLESVDFYISQNYRDLALDTLSMLETQYGSHPEIKLRREQLAGITPAYSSEISAPEKSAEPVKTVESLNSVVVANTGFEDLFAELGEDLEVAALAAPQTADYETHYNLGLAYKEMGLMDDAVEEFQNAVKMVAAGDGTPRYLQCCNLIGHCFMEKQMPKLAAIWFQRGLDAPGHTEEEYQALRYELATAFEQAGETDKALDLYTGIYAINVAYRNIGDKVKLLQTLQAA
jgi:tetratricopeptide (TPR) repeat protein